VNELDFLTQVIITEGEIVSDSDTFAGTDRPFLKQFLLKNKKVVEGLRTLIVTIKKVIATQEVLKDEDMNQLQAIWQRHIKSQKPIPQNATYEKQDVRRVKDSISGNDYLEKHGPLGGYRVLLQQLGILVNKLNLFENENEMSPAIKKLFKDWDIKYSGIGKELETLTKSPLSSKGLVNMNPVNNILSMLRQLTDDFAEVKTVYGDIEPEQQPQGGDAGGDPGNEEAEEGGGDGGKPGGDNPAVVDPEPELIDELRKEIIEFSKKFFCKGLNKAKTELQRREFRAECDKEGVAKTKTDQHEMIIKVISVLDRIIEKEEQESFGEDEGETEQPQAGAAPAKRDDRNFLGEEINQTNLRAYKADLESFIEEAEATRKVFAQAQNEKGQVGRMFVDRATKRAKDLLDLAGVLYGDLDKLAGSRSAGEEQAEPEVVAEEMLSEGIKEVNAVYKFVTVDVLSVLKELPKDRLLSEIGPKIKEAKEKLDAVLKFFPKGKVFGSGTASAKNAKDKFDEALKELGESSRFIILRSLDDKLEQGGGATSVKAAAKRVRRFAELISKFFGVDMPAAFNKKVEDQNTPEPTETEEPETPEAGAEEPPDEPGEEETTDEPGEEEVADEDPPSEIETEADLQKLFPTTFVNRIKTRVEGASDELIDAFGKFLVIYNNEQVVSETPDKVAASVFTHSKLEDKRVLSKKKSRRALKLMSRNRNLRKDFEVLKKWFYTGRTNTNAKKMFVKMFLNQYIDKGKPKFKMPLQKIINYKTSKALEVSENKQTTEEMIERLIKPLVINVLREKNGKEKLRY